MSRRSRPTTLPWGIDPNVTTICVQSAPPALAELTVLYLNVVTVARHGRPSRTQSDDQRRNPGPQFLPRSPGKFSLLSGCTGCGHHRIQGRRSAGQRGSGTGHWANQRDHPTSQQRAGRDLLPEARALIPLTGRLPGVDGKAKMSKSQGNAIPLSASDAKITAAVRRVYTDRGHLRAGDPGRVEGNVVFTYLDVFDDDHDCRRRVEGPLPAWRPGGRLGEVSYQSYPVRHHRADPRMPRCRDKGPDFVMNARRAGTAIARDVTAITQAEVLAGLGLFTWS
jgi:tryptophanyl-tRNA synthetase